LYKDGVSQNQNHQKGGYVQLDFIKKNKDDEEDKSLIYPKNVLETIQNLDKEFEWKDICVLVRKNSQGAAIAQYLIENGIDILSSESLLLKQNERIIFLVNTLQILYNPKDLESRYNVLDFLYNHLEISTSKHEFFDALILLPSVDFYEQLNNYGIDINASIFHEKSLYDSIEYLIRGFKLNEKSNIYLQFFLDFVLEFQIQDGSDLAGFLEHWENKKDKLSISVPEEKNAVRIMTIHKAKGLQFPIVIFPHDLSIYENKFEKLWYNFEKPDDFNGFSKVLITQNNALQYTDNEGIRLYNELREQKELDNFNLLYVVLTRAIEQLYILTDYGLDVNKKPKTNYFSGLFTRYLMRLKIWQESQLQYSFGNKNKVEVEMKNLIDNKPESAILEAFISTDPASHQLLFHTRNSLLWDTEKGKAIDYGNLIHEILAQIITVDDAPLVINQYIENGLIEKEEIEKISNKIDRILHHKLLKKYFDSNHNVLCEREIYTIDGQIHIPDRLVFFNEKRVGILDYKTGLPMIEHRDQIDFYAKIISEMGYEVIEKYLVYIGDEIEVKGEI
jgi:superfamily I DNA/RNA helicase